MCNWKKYSKMRKFGSQKANENYLHKYNQQFFTTFLISVALVNV